MTLDDIVKKEMAEDTFGVVINDIYSVLQYDPNLITNASNPLGGVLN